MDDKKSDLEIVLELPREIRQAICRVINGESFHMTKSMRDDIEYKKILGWDSRDDKEVVSRIEGEILAMKRDVKLPDRLLTYVQQKILPD